MKRYNVVLADPPWQQTKGGLRKVRPNQERKLDYPTLSLCDIKDILGKVNGEVLFLWTIDKFLFDAERIAKELGYRLHARLIWDKENGVAPAFTVRFAHEYLLWLYIPGKLVPIEQKGKFTTVFRERATKHSKKPIIVYEFIEAIYPNKTKLELFAREKREGWDVWGNEVDSDITMEEYE